MFIVAGILLLREQTVGGKIAIIGGIILVIWALIDIIIMLIEYSGSMTPVELANALFHYFLGLAFLPILLIISGVLGLKSDWEKREF